MRVVALVTLLLAACLMGMGTLSRSWMSLEGDVELLDQTVNMRWGLTSTVQCEAGFFGFGDCTRTSHTDAGWPKTSVALGNITLGVGLLASVLFGLAAILLGVESKWSRLVTVTSLVTGSFALIPAVMFARMLPASVTSLDPSVGSSFYLYIIGALIGVGGALVGSRSARRDRETEIAETPGTGPSDILPALPDHLKSAPLPGAPRTARPTPVPLPSPAIETRHCPYCGGPARWVLSHRRYGCDRCQRFA